MKDTIAELETAKDAVVEAERNARYVNELWSDFDKNVQKVIDNDSKAERLLVYSSEPFYTGEGDVDNDLDPDDATVQEDIDDEMVIPYFLYHKAYQDPVFKPMQVEIEHLMKEYSEAQASLTGFTDQVSEAVERLDSLVDDIGRQNIDLEELRDEAVSVEEDLDTLYHDSARLEEYWATAERAWINSSVTRQFAHPDADIPQEHVGTRLHTMLLLLEEEITHMQSMTGLLQGYLP